MFGAATVAGILVDPWGKSLTLAVAIIAGFGRFGQIAGRLLMSCGFEVVVLDPDPDPDPDPDHIETLCKFGVKVFYGDATRLDLLHAAGAAQAVVLINAIDNREDNLALSRLAQEHFPSLNLVVRARDMGHIITLRQLGIEAVEGETFESALSLGRRALEQLGIGRYEAR